MKTGLAIARIAPENTPDRVAQEFDHREMHREIPEKMAKVFNIYAQPLNRSILFTFLFQEDFVSDTAMTETIQWALGDTPGILAYRPQIIFLEE